MALLEAGSAERKPRFILTFFGVVALGVLLVGYLFNLVM